MTKKTKTVKKTKSLCKYIFSGVLAVSAIFLLVSIIRLDFLSLKYLFPVTVLIAVISALVILWVMKSKGKLNIAAKVLAVILSVFMIVSSLHLSKIKGLIEKATGADSKLHTVHVIVMKDSPYETLDDLIKDTDKIGANLDSDAANINDALDEIKEKTGETVEAKSYTNYLNLIDDLYDGTLDAIILNKAYIPLIEEIKDQFEEVTRILETFENTEKIVNSKGPVNVSKDTFTIYVSGIDTYGSINAVSRSDVNMLVTVNPVTNQILLTSIPRDYHVRLNKNGKKDKLTHAGLYGVDESMKTLENLLNGEVTSGEKIDVDYFLRVNFSSVTKIVDALGGVNVVSEFSFPAAGKQIVKGKNTLNGKEALAFTRHRKSLPGGDNDRIKNQQALITGVLNKVMSPAIITNFNRFLSSINGVFEFSLEEENLNKIVKKQLDSMPSWEIISIQLTGRGATSSNVYSWPGRPLYVAEPNYETVKHAADLILKMENNERIKK